MNNARWREPEQPGSALRSPPLGERGPAALAEHFGHQLLVGRRTGTAARIAGGSGHLGRGLGDEHRRLHAGLPVLVQLTDDVVEALAGETAAQLHGDHVAVHMQTVGLAGGEQPPSQLGGGSRTDGIGSRREPLVALPGERAVRLEPEHARDRALLLDDTDHLTHGRRRYPSRPCQHIRSAAVITERHYGPADAQPDARADARTDARAGARTDGRAGVHWIDVIDPTHDELDAIASRFALNANTFDEAHRQSARPTLRRYPDHAYIVAFSADLAEIDMYLGPDWLVTVRHKHDDGEAWDPDETIERFERRCGTEPTAAVLLLTLIDVLIDDYFDLTDVIEDRTEAVEDRIFAETLRTERETQEQLFGLRRDLLQLRRVVMPLREVLGAISRQELVGVEGEALALARDLYDRMLRVVEVVDEQRELLGNAVDAHLAVMSNQMNLVMKQLTAWGSIVFGATLIAGIYGMNFEHMPELTWYLGYPMALGMMAVLSLVLFRVFRRRDWL